MIYSRTESPDGYRFGYNGKEDDNETGTQDYGMRIYNPALARFLSVDPLFKSFAFYSPYQFAGNTPIMAIDLDGLEIKEKVTYNPDGSKTVHRIVNVKSINRSTVSDADIAQKIEDYKCDVETSLTGSYIEKDGTTVFYTAEVYVTPVDEVTKRDFYIEWVDLADPKDPYTKGLTEPMGNPVSSRMRINAKEERHITRKSGPHELEHAGGLLDAVKLEDGTYTDGEPTEDGKPNILDDDNAMITEEPHFGIKLSLSQQKSISIQLKMYGQSEDEKDKKNKPKKGKNGH